MSYARKVDGNHAEIVSALRGAGAVVIDMSHIGGGVPDLWVSSRHFAGWLEIKNGEKPPSARELTEPQKEFFATVNREKRTHAHIVLSAQQALNLVFGESA